MSLLMVAIFERDVKLLAPKTSGEFLGRSFDMLDEIAIERGLAPLSSFADSREVPEGFSGTPDELDELLGPCTEWHDGNSGAAALSQLAMLVSSDTKARARLGAAVDEIAAELRDLAAQVAMAARAGVRFRLDLQ
jgi:hypothetical protein